MITGWLAPEDCPACGGPLLEQPDPPAPGMAVLACPGCGHATTRPATGTGGGDDCPDDPGPREAA